MLGADRCDAPYLKVVNLQAFRRVAWSGVKVALVASAGWFIPVHAQWEPVVPDPEVPAFANFLGQGISTVDFNLDGWDDLTVTNITGELLFYAGGPGGFVPVDFGIPVAPGRPIGLMWLDLDNDGDRDFVHSSAMGFTLFGGAGSVSRSRIWVNEDGLMVDRTSEWGWDVLEDRACTGLAFSDMDLDGDLDVMVSNYALECEGVWLSENALFRSVEGVGFEDISVASGIADGLQPSFQGVWMDLDFNALPDLVVINDAGVQQGCNAPTAAYLNGGDGSFTAAAAALGLDLVMLAMTATLGDPDADGEEELFMTNELVPSSDSTHHQGAALLDRIEDGVFQERAADWGLDLQRWSWGSVWLDQDLDGWDDLLVATHLFNVPGDGQDVASYDNYFLRHPGAGLHAGMPFSDASAGWDGVDRPLYGWGRCDVDGDGRPDVVGVGTGPFAGVWRNTVGEDAPERKGLTVAVCGTHSNSEAIGTRLILHAGNHRQQRTLRAGEDFFSQHSATQFFGLDTIALADSLEIFWPNGQRSCWYDLAADSLYRFVEGQEDFAANVEGIPGTDSVWIHLSPPPKWTGVWLNGLEVDTTTFAVIAGSPAAFEVQWFGGLFSLEGQVDWAEWGYPPAGCTIPVADNFDPEAEVDDGSCTYASFCGVGTHWSQEMQQCVSDFQCSEDINGNGTVDVADLLLLLNAFGSGCAEESEDD